jgi:DNA ligase (NAD+)
VERRTVGQERSVAVYCTNRSCYAQSLERNAHFASRRALDIRGLGDRIVEKLQRADLVKDAADFFALEKGDLLGLEGFADLAAENLLRAIAGRRRAELPRFLNALGIPQVGEATSLALAEHFGTLGKIATASADELTAVPDVGPGVAQSIAEWFAHPHHQRLLKKFRQNGLTVLPYRRAARGQLSGKIFVVTGSLKAMSREEAKARIRERGGKTSENVSTKTSYVVVGKDPGTKYEKARALGVPTLDEATFRRLLG